MNPVEAVSSADGLSAEVAAGPHRFKAGAGAGVPGGDAGVEPHELLAAALAACGAMTVTLYAKRKGWKLENASVTVTAEAGPEGFNLRKTVTLSGTLSVEEKERLLQVADRCPVHKTLGESIRIVTTPLDED
ncbi:MAG: OsmC family protein [Elusimicrobia bacterium]|nr:OsmC family protein [Elusimicrobiota bacterium]